MIVTEFMTINGKAFVRTYSDNGYMVERDGIRYAEAIDPAEFGRVYTETDEPIDGYTSEATESDYQDALRKMGVEV
jgi:hypothetical protein